MGKDKLRRGEGRIDHSPRGQSCVVDTVKVGKPASWTPWFAFLAQG